MQRAMQAVDPQPPFAGFHSMEDIRYRSLAQERFQAALLAAVGWRLALPWRRPCAQ
jgi:hypothetical protein